MGTHTYCPTKGTYGQKSCCEYFMCRRSHRQCCIFLPDWASLKILCGPQGLVLCQIIKIKCNQVPQTRARVWVQALYMMYRTIFIVCYIAKTKRGQETVEWIMSINPCFSHKGQKCVIFQWLTFLLLVCFLRCRVEHCTETWQPWLMLLAPLCVWNTVAGAR